MKININDLIGKPYRDHARGPDAYDCYGLAIEVCRRYGKKFQDLYYDCNALELADVNRPTLDLKKLDTPCEGALLEMNYKNELHIGVCLSDKEFIHMTSQGCRVSHIGAIEIRGVYELNTRL